MKLAFSISGLLGKLLLMAVVVDGHSKVRYRLTGQGGNAYQYGEVCGAWPFGSYIDAYASEESTKDTGNGSTGSQVTPYMSSYFSLWSSCTETTATLIEPDWGAYELLLDRPAVSFHGNKLATGSAKATFAGLSVNCELVHETYDWGDWTWYDCDYANPVYVSVEVQVTWTGQGTSYPDRSTSTYRNPSVFSRWTYKGTTRDAVPTFATRVNGDIFPMNSIASFGSLYKITSASMELFKN